MKRISAIFCMLLLSGTAFAQTAAGPAPSAQATTAQTAPVPAAPVVTPQPPAAPVAATTPPAVAPPTLTLEEQFKGQLPFPLTEAKMIAFAEASRRVRRINNKWDVQIAAAETDQRANEYNNFAVEEITKSLQKIPGLTLEEYTAMTGLTARNQDFNRIYMAYQDLLAQGKIKLPEEPKPAVPAPVRPVVQPVAKPVAAPAGSGTAPAPQGSPKPPYSQQPSRQ